MEPQKPLITIRQLTRRHPYLSIGQIRWLLFNRKINGLSEEDCLYKPSGKILIDEDRFIRWLRSKKM